MKTHGELQNMLQSFTEPDPQDSSPGLSDPMLAIENCAACKGVPAVEFPGIIVCKW
jgi:hypothetical protein